MEAQELVFPDNPGAAGRARVGNGASSRAVFPALEADGQVTTIFIHRQAGVAFARGRLNLLQVGELPRLSLIHI